MVIRGILDYTESPFELILVYDGCTDNSEKIVNREIKFKKGSMKKLKVLYTPDVYEVKANNAGMKTAIGSYFIIIQDDQIIYERGWEKRLTYPMEVYNNVFAVSARAAHDNVKAKKGLKYLNLVDNRINKYVSRNTFFIRDSCNRGPLALRADMIKKLNYLDEEYAPQQWDDIDLCYKAYKKYGLLAGLYPIKFESKPEWGTSRKNSKSREIHFKQFWKNADLIYKKHKDLIDGEKHTENRNLIYPDENYNFFNETKRKLLYSLVQANFQFGRVIKRLSRLVKNGPAVFKKS